MAGKGPKAAKLMSNLTNVIEVKKRHLEDTERKHRVKRKGISNFIAETDMLNQSYYKEIKEMQFSPREHFQWISKQIERQNIELQKLEVVIKKKQKRLAKKIEKNAAKNRLLHEKRKANERMMRLADDHKKEKEKLQEKIFILEKQLNAKQALEVQIECMKGQLNVMMHTRDVVPQKIEDLRRTLKVKEKELKVLKSFNQVMSVKERLNDDELQETCKELLEGLEELPNAEDVGVKIVEELANPFHDAMKLLYNETEVNDIASKLCSLWQKYLWERNWHPFKVITANGITQGVMVNDVDSLEILMGNCGEEVYKDVMTAWREKNDYNSSDKCITTELWNFTESRKATLKEGVSCLLKIWDAQKCMRVAYNFN